MGKRPPNSADSVQVVMCNECDFVHLYLCDEHGNAFAQAVIDEDIVASLQRALRSRPRQVS
jgi:hypothetical protein